MTMPVPESSTRSAYKKSMHAILDYIGLKNYGTEKASMPVRTSHETELIEANMAHVREVAMRHAERHKDHVFQNNKRTPNSVLDALQGCGRSSGQDAATTIFLTFEESMEWRAFLRGLPTTERHTATVKRRLSVAMWRAHSRGMCLYCWFPSNMCLCAELDELHRNLPHDVLRRTVEATMLLHGEEVMRSTNSGHIAAYLLDAPLRIWGVPLDDAYLQQLQAVETVQLAGEASSCCRVDVHHVSLYPEVGAPDIQTFIKDSLLVSEAPHKEGASSSQPQPSPSPSLDGGETRPGKKVHLILSDSTWGQALSLNRHITREVPRVGLTISAEYESLFAALRKRTRESGVSTLEATGLAMEQCLQAMGHPAEAEVTMSSLTAIMKRFVDVRCLLKFSDAQFAQGDALADVVDRRDAVRREEAVLRLAQLEEKMKTDEAARKFLLPPVSNYCYCCDRVIGWHRMPEHVLGKMHRAALKLNPTCAPSEKSSGRFVPDFSRPMRCDRLDETQQQQQQAAEGILETGDC